jgi:hypothetical protein
MTQTNGNYDKPAQNNSVIFEFRSRLQRIENAIQPLEKIHGALENIEKTLEKISNTFDKIVEKLFISLKWLSLGVLIIVLVAMGFEGVNKLFDKF